MAIEKQQFEGTFVAGKCADFDIRVVRSSKTPLIDNLHEGSRDNVGGYEDGYAIKLENGEYHMLITEMFKDGQVMNQGIWSPARIGHWVSTDGKTWRRTDTVVAGNAVACDPKENTWSPSYFYNEEENAWNVFWRGSNAVFRYGSVKKGREGISGPYEERKMILPPLGGEANEWDFGFYASFGNIFKAVDGRWYSFYSSGGESNGDNNWLSGLMTADHFDGPWTRNPNTKKVTFRYCENPYVSVYDGMYFCVYDDLSCQKSIGVGYSLDGINWKRKLVDLSEYVDWADDDWYVNSIRTPMSLIREEDGTYTVLFCAAQRSDGYFCIGSVSLAIDTVLSEDKSAYAVDVTLDERLSQVCGAWHAEHAELSCHQKEKCPARMAVGSFTDFEIETSLRCVDIRKVVHDAAGGHFYEKENARYNTRGGIFFGDKGTEGEDCYCVMLTADSQLLLLKGNKLLDSCKCPTLPFIFKTLRVSVAGRSVCVYCGNEIEPSIRYFAEEELRGRAGLAVSGSHWHFESLYVR